jgi:hypothetical protein
MLCKGSYKGLIHLWSWARPGPNPGGIVPTEDSPSRWIVRAAALEDLRLADIPVLRDGS